MCRLLQTGVMKVFILSMLVASVHSTTVDVTWSIPMDQAPIDANVGDVISFNWIGTHNVQMLSDIDNCSSWIGEAPLSSESPYEYTVTADDAGLSLYFACEISGHCGANQKITVQVADADDDDGDDDHDDHDGHDHDDDDDSPASHVAAFAVLAVALAR